MKGECPAARAAMSDVRMIASRSVSGARTSRHGRLSSLRASVRARMTQSAASTATAGPVRIAHAAALPGTAAPAANRANAENASAAPSRRQSKTTSPGVAGPCCIAAARRTASSMHTPAACALAKKTTAQTTTADAWASTPFSRAVADAPTARTPTTVAIVARAARRIAFSVSNDSATSAAGRKRRFTSSSPWTATTSASCRRYSASSRRRARPRVWRVRPSSSSHCSTVVTRGRRPALRRRRRPTASYRALSCESLYLVILGIAPESAVERLSAGVAESGDDVVECVGEWLFELFVGAGLGCAVVAPAHEVGKVPEPGPLHVLVLHLQHSFRP